MKAVLITPVLLLIATLAFGQNPSGPPVPIPPIHVVVGGATVTLPTCGTLVCYYVLDMRATATITLAPNLNGQAIVIKAWQNPTFGGGFTPTFQAANGYTLKWANGAPPSAVITSGNSQMYSLVADTQSEATPVYNEMRPGTE